MQQPHSSIAEEEAELKDLLQKVRFSETRERALCNLSTICKKPDQLKNLGDTLGSTPGIIPIFIHEIVSAYPLLNPSTQPPKVAVNRVANILTLLQKMANSPQSRKLLIDYHVLQYLLPFLRMEYSKAVDTFRVSALAVIGMLVQCDQSDIISYLVYDANMFPLCLESMSMKLDPTKDIGKILSTFVVERLLLSNIGSEYISKVPERQVKVMDALEQIIPFEPTDGNSKKLLRHCLKCYAHLGKSESGLQLLRERFPKELRDVESLESKLDEATLKHLKEICARLE